MIEIGFIPICKLFIIIIYKRFWHDVNSYDKRDFDQIVEIPGYETVSLDENIRPKTRLSHDTV